MIASFYVGVPLSGFTDEPTPIPRRTIIRTPAIDGDEIDRMDLAVLSELDELLIGGIVELQQILRVNEDAATVIEIRVSTEGESYLIEIDLKIDEKIVESSGGRIGTNENLREVIIPFIAATAAAFAPHLSMVLPEIRLEQYVQSDRVRKTLESVNFADSLATPIVFSLWTTGPTKILRFPTVESADFAVLKIPPLLRLDAAFYRRRNSGIVSALLVEYDRGGYAFGYPEFEGNKPPYHSDSKNTFLRGGIGWAARTLGEISARFQAILFVGAVRVVAVDRIVKAYDRPGIDLEPGERKWLFYPIANFESILEWNVNERISIGARFSMGLNLVAMATLAGYPAVYDIPGNGLFARLGSIGISYRPRPNTGLKPIFNRLRKSPD